MSLSTGVFWFFFHSSWGLPSSCMPSVFDGDLDLVGSASQASHLNLCFSRPLLILLQGYHFLTQVRWKSRFSNCCPLTLGGEGFPVTAGLLGKVSTSGSLLGLYWYQPGWKKASATVGRVAFWLMIGGESPDCPQGFLWHHPCSKGKVHLEWGTPPHVLSQYHRIQEKGLFLPRVSGSPKVWLCLLWHHPTGKWGTFLA